MNCVLSLATPPIASWTSGTSFTLGRSDSSNDASVVPESPLASKGDFGVIVTSVFR
jgi:hypothetical protein